MATLEQEGEIMSEFIKLAQLSKAKQYTVPMIIAGQSSCFFDKKLETLVPSCKNIPSLISKAYKFDSMVNKLMNVAAIQLLEYDTPILWSNNHEKLKDNNLVNAEGKSMAATPIRGAVQFYHGRKEVEKILFNFNVKAPNGPASGLDDLFSKIPHELAHFVFFEFSRDAYTHTLLPYKNNDQKNKFETQAKKVVSEVLKEFSQDEVPTSFKDLRDQFCEEADEIKSSIINLLVKEGRGGSQKKHFILLNKHEEVLSIQTALCPYNTEALQHAELGVRHFEQINNGIEANLGVHYQDLTYLEPLADYTLEVLYPEFDKYISEHCQASKTYKCHFDKNTELVGVTLIEPIVDCQ